MTFIKVIEPEEAEGRLKEIYDDLLEKRGKLAEVHKVQSLNPESIVNHMELYMTIMYGKSPLKRVTREMIAVVVSKANNCEYCQTHHGAAINHYWKDEAKVQQLRDDFRALDLSDEEMTWCELADRLTRTPSAPLSDLHEKLRDLGVEDRALLDATLVIGYFNFVNRIVMGLGVHLEKDKGVGYNYG